MLSRYDIGLEKTTFCLTYRQVLEQFDPQWILLLTLCLTLRCLVDDVPTLLLPHHHSILTLTLRRLVDSVPTLLRNRCRTQKTVGVLTGAP